MQRKSFIRMAITLAAVCMVWPSSFAAAQNATASGSQQLSSIDGLGSLSFPNSGATAAQNDFISGVLLLHSFEFEPAAEAFRRAQGIDPGFALAYWGEAMTYNHPLWRQVDVEAARAALDRLAPDPEQRRSKAKTHRESMYLDAVEALYGEGDKTTRDLAYMSAMKRLVEMHPDDDEARSFYGLSILGSANGTRDFATYMRAAATVQPVFNRNTNHPGAAHYLIHSFDDPVHAPLGLLAAEAYSEIAPDAAHAQHMTTHIFVALGMWDRVVANNIRAMRVQDADLESRGRKPNVCGHYSSWRHYGHLQLGEFEDATNLMDECYARAIRKDASRGERAYFADMRGLHVLDADPASLERTWDVPADHPLATWSTSGTSELAVFSYQFLNAWLAIQAGRLDEARSIAGRFPTDHDQGKVYRLQIEGLVALAENRDETGIELLRQSAEAEAALPFEFGPPTLIKPTYELLGEALIRLGRLEEARVALGRAESRTPNRANVVRALSMLR